MITASLVQSSVVDIRNPASGFPPALVADANVLYWNFYPNFASLQYAGGKQPLYHQITHYPRYWKRAATGGALFHVDKATLSEFAKIAEYAELEAIWLTDSPPPQPDPGNPVTQFDPRVCKFARYHYAGQLGIVRGAVETMIASLRKSVALLPQFPTPADHQAMAMHAWRPSLGDFPDAVMVATATRHAIPHILSDDMDLATFAGITVYTANLKTIDAARAAGKLI